MPSSLGIGEVEKNFCSDCLQAYRNAADYLKRMLPSNSFNSFINPEKRNGSGSLEGISEFTRMVLSALPNVLLAIFPAVLTTEDVCDIVCTEWRLYQTKFSRLSLSNKCRKQNVLKETTFLLGRSFHVGWGRFGYQRSQQNVTW